MRPFAGPVKWAAVYVLAILPAVPVERHFVSSFRIRHDETGLENQ